MPINCRRLPKLDAEDHERFWAKVDKRGRNECWPWKGRRVAGYGTFFWRSDLRLIASRVAFFIATGIDPRKSLVLHSCDNPPCVNPRHLSLGTIADNIHEAWERKRANSNAGEKHPGARLTLDDIRAIRSQWNDGQYPRAELAKRYGITKAHVGNIMYGRVWKDAC